MWRLINWWCWFRWKIISKTNFNVTRRTKSTLRQLEKSNMSQRPGQRAILDENAKTKYKQMRCVFNCSVKIMIFSIILISKNTPNSRPPRNCIEQLNNFYWTWIFLFIKRTCKTFNAHIIIILHYSVQFVLKITICFCCVLYYIESWLFIWFYREKRNLRKKLQMSDLSHETITSSSRKNSTSSSSSDFISTYSSDGDTIHETQSQSVPFVEKVLNTEEIVDQMNKRINEISSVLNVSIRRYRIFTPVLNNFVCDNSCHPWSQEFYWAILTGMS